MAAEELHCVLPGNLSRVKSNELSDTENKGTNSSSQPNTLKAQQPTGKFLSSAIQFVFVFQLFTYAMQFIHPSFLS